MTKVTSRQQLGSFDTQRTRSCLKFGGTTDQEPYICWVVNSGDNGKDRKLRPKNNTRKKKKILVLKVVTRETEDSMKGTGTLFRAGIELLSTCSHHTSFGGRDWRGDSFDSGSSGVRGTSTSSGAFGLMLSSGKGTEALLLSFFIAPTLVSTVAEHHR